MKSNFNQNGLQIKELRKKLNMTQLEFARYTKIPLDTIRNWEQGTREVKEYIIYLIEDKIKNDTNLKK